MNLPTDTPESSRHFDLQSITWGYRDLFDRSIRRMFADGRLGEQRAATTEHFFRMMQRADRGGFDHVLKEFLGALHPGNRWLMDLPRLFAEVTELGAAVAEHRIYYGTRFFEALADGHLGNHPDQLHHCLAIIRRLMQSDCELALGWIDGAHLLQDRLTRHEQNQYVNIGLKIAQRSVPNAAEFLAGRSPSSEAYIRTITRECRLDDVHDRLVKLLLALTGREHQLANHHDLDSDELLERGSTTVLANHQLFLPARVRCCDRQTLNTRWYMLATVMAAAMVRTRSFPLLHGHADFPTCMTLTGHAPERVNLFQILETCRAAQWIGQHWPGALAWLDWGIGIEHHRRLDGGPEHLLMDLLQHRSSPELQQLTAARCADCQNCMQTAEYLQQMDHNPWLASYPRLAAQLIRPISFISDFLMPMQFSSPGTDARVADLNSDNRTTAAPAAGQAQAQRQIALAPGTASDTDESEQTDPHSAVVAAYLYDEWDHEHNMYKPQWCKLFDQQADRLSEQPAPAQWMAHAERAKRWFEKLKPELARRVRHQEDGQSINIDHLVEHIIDRHRDPGTPSRFYEQLQINHRDPAVLLLIDLSGSTGGQNQEQVKTLDVEKQAAIIFGHALAGLGDRFAVGGFLSNGREQCQYISFKTFDERWSDTIIRRLCAAWARGSTRMGPALRHAGRLLSQTDAMQKLILLITDGKPMDQGYQPQTGYAQHDVRMACEENLKKDVHTYAITTEENTPEDLTLMFTRRRYSIIPDITQLPTALQRVYLSTTC